MATPEPISPAEEPNSPETPTPQNQFRTRSIWMSNLWTRGAPAWLGGLLIVQIALIAFVYWPSDAAQVTGGSLLADFDAGTVQQLQIEDANGQSVTLLRNGEEWVVADTDNFPANRTKAEETLAKLAEMNTNRPVTRTEGSHARLQVAANDFNRRITLTGRDGEETIVYLGASAGGAATHVRVQGDDAVYLTGQLAAWEVEPSLSGWVNTSYVSIPAGDIQTVAVHNPQGTLELSRDLNDEWTADWLENDETLAPSEVNVLLNRVASISLSDIVGQTPPDDFDPDAPLIRVELGVRPTREDDDGPSADTADLESVTIYIDQLPAALADVAGAPDTMSSDTTDDTANDTANDVVYFAKSSTSDYYVQVSSFTVEPLISLTPDDLLQTDSPSDAPFDPEQLDLDQFDPQSGLQLPGLEELPLDESMLDESMLEELMLEELQLEELDIEESAAEEPEVE